MSITVIGDHYFTDRIDTLQTLQVDLIPDPDAAGMFRLELYEESRNRVCQAKPEVQAGDYDISADGLRHMRRLINAALGDAR